MTSKLRLYDVKIDDFREPNQRDIELLTLTAATYGKIVTDCISMDEVKAAHQEWRKRQKEILANFPVQVGGGS